MEGTIGEVEGSGCASNLEELLHGWLRRCRCRDGNGDAEMEMEMQRCKKGEMELQLLGFAGSAHTQSYSSH